LVLARDLARMTGVMMNDIAKPRAGSILPQITLPKVGGGTVTIGGQGIWQMLVVYRGRHCPLCKKYLKTLDELLDQYVAAGVAVAVASGDPIEKAEADVAQFGWRFPVAYAMNRDQMSTLGLYVSEPRSPQETDRPFPEPGVFIVNPANQLQIVDISNAPFARPDLAALLQGIKFVIEKGYPIRGTLG
jgi:peroxiredoxin